MILSYANFAPNFTMFEVGLMSDWSRIEHMIKKTNIKFFVLQVVNVTVNYADEKKM